MTRSILRHLFSLLFGVTVAALVVGAGVYGCCLWVILHLPPCQFTDPRDCSPNIGDGFEMLLICVLAAPVVLPTALFAGWWLGRRLSRLVLPETD